MTVVWLASASARRGELLRTHFQKKEYRSKLFQQPLISDELSEQFGIEVGKQVQSIAISKLRNAYTELILGRVESIFDSNQNQDEVIVLISDTLVEDPDTITLALGKPSTASEALSMFVQLSGKRHLVWSATGLIFPERMQSRINNRGTIVEHLGHGKIGMLWIEHSVVEFPCLEIDVIEELVRSEGWVGKAGGYDLAGEMGGFAKVISGTEICVLGIAKGAIDALDDCLNS